MAESISDESKALYAKYREELLKRQLSNTEKFDGAVLTLSSTVLGFSLSFIRNVVPIENAQYIWLLIAAWGLFILAILSTMGSYISSQASINKQLIHAGKYYLEGEEEYLSKKNGFATLTRWAGYVSGAFFAIAMIFLVIFVAVNIVRANVHNAVVIPYYI